MPFQPGNPGGPGRPRGSRNAVNQLLDGLAIDGAEAIAKKLIEGASGDDSAAARFVMNRIWTAPKGRPVDIDLPSIKTPADLVSAHAVVSGAIADKSITPQEGAAICTVLDNHRRAFELLEQHRRVEALEAELASVRRRTGCP